MLFCFCFCVFYTSLVFFLDSHFVIFLTNTIGFEMCSLYNNFFFFYHLTNIAYGFLLGIGGIYTQIGQIFYPMTTTKNSPIKLIRIHPKKPFDIN